MLIIKLLITGNSWLFLLALLMCSQEASATSENTNIKEIQKVLLQAGVRYEDGAQFRHVKIVELGGVEARAIVGHIISKKHHTKERCYYSLQDLNVKGLYSGKIKNFTKEYFIALKPSQGECDFEAMEHKGEIIGTEFSSFDEFIKVAQKLDKSLKLDEISIKLNSSIDTYTTDFLDAASYIESIGEVISVRISNKNYVVLTQWRDGGDHLILESAVAGK